MAREKPDAVPSSKQVLYCGSANYSGAAGDQNSHISPLPADSNRVEAGGVCLSMDSGGGTAVLETVLAAPQVRDDRWVVYYDGQCNLCHASAKTIKGWARDRNKPLETHTLQSPGAKAKGYGEKMVLETPQKTYYAGDAWLKVMELAPWHLRWISWLNNFGPTRWLAKLFYGFIANTRYFWFGKRQMGPSCQASGGG